MGYMDRSRLRTWQAQDSYWEFYDYLVIYEKITYGDQSALFY